MRVNLLLSALLLIAATSCCGESKTKDPVREATYQAYQPTREQQKQIDAWLADMSLEEKVIQLASYYPNNNDRLDIPHIQAGECLHGASNSELGTSFPQAIAMGSTWNPELIEEIATVIAREVRTLRMHHCYSPNLGLARDPRWGRFEECYSEDPVLTSQIGKAFILGLQGTGSERFSSDKIVATGKHFVADGRPQSGHNGAAEELSERILHELYLKPYKVAIQEAHLGAIMPAHHTINGEPCHSSQWLLQDVLRDEFGFDGIVVCDNGDIRGIKSNFRLTETYEQAAKLAIEAGVNNELAWLTKWGDKRMFGPVLQRAVESGMVSMKTLDKAVSKILHYKLMLDIGSDSVLDDEKMDKIAKANEIKDYASTATDANLTVPRDDWESVLYNDESNALALEAARQAIILLENKNSTLPLDQKKIKSIAIIGPNADDPSLLGTYSTRKARYFVTVREGVENFVKGKNIKVNYQEGVKIGSDDRSGISKAVRAAAQSDVAIVVLGDNRETVKENQDRDDIKLPGLQEELLKAVEAAGKPVILVLLHGRTPELIWAKENVDAILDGWFLGQETGNAVAETLFGLNNPGGKTTVTYPRNVGILPQCYNDMPGGRVHNIYQGETAPCYPFGYGLSYTTFAYGKPVISADVMASADQTVYVTIPITNTGDVKGDEVVQMYVFDEISSLSRPLKELKAFKRITLNPGETKSVEFPISRKDLEFWKAGEWIVEPGDFAIMVGSSSEDLQKVKLTLK